MSSSMIAPDPSIAHHEKVLDTANTIGAKWGIGAGLLVGGATLLATKKWNGFNKYMSISAKVSIPVMTAMGVFSYKYEMVMYDAQFNPEAYGLPKLALKPGQKEPQQSKMPVSHRIINSM